jgi:hypothetical protein
MLVKFKDGNQDKFPVQENVVLIKASSDDGEEHFLLPPFSRIH